MPYVNSVKDLMEGVRQGRFTSVGGYPIFFLTADGGTLDPRTVKAELSQISRETRDYHGKRGGADPSWAIVAYDVNWEDASMYDDHTGERIPSAYAEDEAEGHLEGDNPATKAQRSRWAKKAAKTRKKAAKRSKAAEKGARSRAAKKAAKRRKSKKTNAESSADIKLKARMRGLIGRA
jgi:hypothetical protein